MTTRTEEPCPVNNPAPIGRDVPTWLLACSGLVATSVKEGFAVTWARKVPSSTDRAGVEGLGVVSERAEVVSSSVVDREVENDADALGGKTNGMDAGTLALESEPGARAAGLFSVAVNGALLGEGVFSEAKPPGFAPSTGSGADRVEIPADAGFGSGKDAVVGPQVVGSEVAVSGVF